MKKPIFIDASALAKGSCCLRLFLSCGEGYTRKDDSLDILPFYGTCFHLFAKRLTELEGDKVKALNETYSFWCDNLEHLNDVRQYAYMNEAHLGNTCLAYYEWWKNNKEIEVLKSPINGEYLTEVSFAIPVHEDVEHVIYIAGVMDRIAKIRGGCHIIDDFKTTNKKDPDKHLSAFALSTQLNLYYWALRTAASLYPNTLLAELFNHLQPLGCSITGVYLDPKEPTSFHRSRIFFYDELFPFFDKFLRNKVSHLAKEFVSNPEDYWKQKEGILSGDCQTPYGSGCPYFYACLNGKSRELFYQILNNNFRVKEYNPLTR